MKFEWKGVFPAVTTKFTDDDQLDFNAFDLNLKAQLDAGVDGIILAGSLGEASTLLQEASKISPQKHSIQNKPKAPVPVICFQDDNMLRRF